MFRNSSQTFNFITHFLINSHFYVFFQSLAKVAVSLFMQAVRTSSGHYIYFIFRPIVDDQILSNEITRFKMLRCRKMETYQSMEYFGGLKNPSFTFCRRRNFFYLKLSSVMIVHENASCAPYLKQHVAL